MIYRDLNHIKNKKFFSIIIGSGPAGISLALKLENKGFNSLIIEAGDLEGSNNDYNLLNGKKFGDTYTDLEHTRLRQFGGTSAIWGGNCSIFNKSDIKKWGIDYKEYLNFINEAKKILNVSDNFYINDIDKNLNVFNVKWSNVKFAEKYFKHIKNSKKIHIVFNTVFKSLNGKKGKVDSIVCSNDKLNKNLKAEKFIICCGGMENSRLLLFSQKKNPDLFKFDLPIGQFYNDHPKKNIGKGIINKDKLNNLFGNMNLNDHPFIDCENLNFSLQSNYLKSSNFLNSGLILRLKREKPNVKFIQQLSCIAPNYFKKIYSDIQNQKIYEFNLSIIQEQELNRNNKIQIDPIISDKYGIPKIILNWTLSENFKLSKNKILENFSSFLIDNDLGRVALNSDYEENKDLTVGFHQLGGTRMGNDKNDSVVDRNLLVHGFENLYISGSSTFRTGGIAFPTLTIVALSCRLGDSITKNYES